LNCSKEQLHSFELGGHVYDSSYARPKPCAPRCGIPSPTALAAGRSGSAWGLRTASRTWTTPVMDCCVTIETATSESAPINTTPWLVLERTCRFDRHSCLAARCRNRLPTRPYLILRPGTSSVDGVNAVGTRPCGSAPRASTADSFAPHLAIRHLVCRRVSTP